MYGEKFEILNSINPELENSKVWKTSVIQERLSNICICPIIEVQAVRMFWKYSKGKW